MYWWCRSQAGCTEKDCEEPPPAKQTQGTCFIYCRTPEQPKIQKNIQKYCWFQSGLWTELSSQEFFSLYTWVKTLPWDQVVKTPVTSIGFSAQLMRAHRTSPHNNIEHCTAGCNCSTLEPQAPGSPAWHQLRNHQHPFLHRLLNLNWAQMADTKTLIANSMIVE